MVFQVPSVNMMPRSVVGFFGTGTSALVAALLYSSEILTAQVLMPTTGPGRVVRLFASDAAILEVQESRKDIPCTVTPVTKPVLGFDLKFHAGYEVTVPLKDLAGSENQLTMVFRVTPEDRPNEPVYFSQHITVPHIEEDAGGPAYLQGAFDVGEGKYHVDWLMRDRLERVCSHNWEIDAVLPSQDKQMALDIEPAIVQPTEFEPFKQEPPVERDDREAPLNIKVVMNFAPQDSGSATLRPLDTSALVSILRSISREPRINKFSIVAFNMQEQRVIYRQEEVSQIDFPALGKRAQVSESGDRGPQAAQPETRRYRVSGKADHHRTCQRRKTARRDHLRRPQSNAR